MGNITSSQNNCKKCDEQYTDIDNKWCKPCQINYLFVLPKKNLGSENEEIEHDITMIDELDFQEFDEEDNDEDDDDSEKFNQMNEQKIFNLLKDLNDYMIYFNFSDREQSSESSERNYSFDNSKLFTESVNCNDDANDFFNDNENLKLL